jgi:N-carbamoylputrescine amidase
MVIDPLGRVVAEAGEEGEVLVTEVDLGVIGETRKWWPFFRDRRIEEYGGLTRRYLEEPGR